MKKLIKPFTALIICLVFASCESDDNGGGGISISPDNNANIALAKGDCMTGDSPAYTDYLRGMVPHMEIVVRGGGAARSAKGAAETPGDLASIKPGYLLILYGKNDVINGVNNADAENSIRSMVNAAVANGTQPLLATLPGMSGAWEERFGGALDDLNARIRNIASSTDAILVDLNSAFSGRRNELIPDGRHPNDDGLILIAQQFAANL